MTSLARKTKGVPFERGLSIPSELGLIVTEPLTFTRDLIAGTSSGYPHTINLAHQLWALTAFRMQQEASGGGPTWLHNFVGSWFCYAAGSTAIIDVFLGTGNSMFASRWVPPSYAAAFMLVRK